MSHTIRASLAALAAAVSIAAAQAATPSIDIPASVDAVAKRQLTEGVFASAVRFLASDALEGRGPATRGDTLAREYLATQLEGMGYLPGGEKGGWEQPFDIVGTTAQLPKTWSFAAKGGNVDFAWSNDYIAGSGVQTEKAGFKDAELVFVGYGIEAPEYRWDDYKGMDVKGKVLVMLNNDPEADPKLFAGKTRLYYGRWTYKYEQAAKHGAVGAIIVHTTHSAGYPWQVVQSSWGGEQFELPAESEPRVQIKAWATEDAMRRLVKSGGFDLDKLVASAQTRTFKPVKLGLRTSIDFTNKVSRVRTANVAGLLPGSDPKLKEEVVVYTAHHDHFGIGEADSTGDKIYNGAEDNALGCAQVLGIARAFAALPERPRRSVLMLFVAGEEQGLLGSKYYSLHPTFKPGRIAANINYDGGNVRGASRDLTAVGYGKSSLDALAKALVEKQGRVLNPDQFPDKGYFYRSDQFSLAKIGVPALYFDEGLDIVGKPAGWGRKQEEEWTEHVYHQPSDEITAEWKFDGVIQDATIGFQAGWLIAQADEMPAWNPGDEFEAARKKAIADR